MLADCPVGRKGKTDTQNARYSDEKKLLTLCITLPGLQKGPLTGELGSDIYSLTVLELQVQGSGASRIMAARPAGPGEGLSLAAASSCWLPAMLGVTWLVRRLRRCTVSSLHMPVSPCLLQLLEGEAATRVGLSKVHATPV